MAELIQKQDTLNEGRVKLNEGIKASERAEGKSDQAVSTAQQAVNTASTAETKADSVQQQFNNVVIEGDSSVEAAQARVKEDGSTFDTLRDRLNSSDSQLAETSKNLNDREINVLQPPIPLKSAKGDGVTDDSEALKSIHNYANTHGVPVKYPNATYLVGASRNIPIETDVDFDGSTLLVDQSHVTTWYDSIFHIRSSHNWSTIPSNSVNAIINEFMADTEYVPSLKEIANENHIVAIEYEVDGILQTGATREIIKETFLHVQNGRIIGNIIRKPATIINARQRKVDLGVSLKNFHVKMVGKLDKPHLRVFYTTRDNVHFDNVNIDRDFEFDTARKVLFFLEESYNSKITNVTAYNPRGTVIPYPEDSIHMEGYIFSVHQSVNTLIENVTTISNTVYGGDSTQPMTWGSMGGNNYKNLTINRCYLSRLDSHTPSNGVKVKDSQLDWVQLCGSGKMTFENVVFTSSRSPQMIQLFASDHTKLAGQWLGEIEVINCTYKPYYTGTDTEFGLLFVGNGANFKYVTYESLQRFYVENLTLDFRYASQNKNIHVKALTLAESLSSEQRKSYVPKEITIDGIYSKTGAIFTPRINTVATTDSVKKLYVNGYSKITYKNIVFKNEPNYSLSGTLYDVEIAEGKLQIVFENCTIPVLFNVSKGDVDILVLHSEINFIKLNRPGAPYEGTALIDSSKINFKTTINEALLQLPSDHQGKFIINSSTISPYEENASSKTINTLIRFSGFYGICMNCRVNAREIETADRSAIFSNLGALNYTRGGLMIETVGGNKFIISLSNTGEWLIVQK